MEQMWILMVFQNGADIQTAMDRLEKTDDCKVPGGNIGAITQKLYDGDETYRYCWSFIKRFAFEPMNPVYQWCTSSVLEPNLIDP